jgi:hypothetical protein
MAVLTLMELDNVSSTFGTKGTEYAMFSASTVDNEIVTCGITHNLLTRLGFGTDNLDSLVGCQVKTKVFTDNRTGELVNPEDQLQKVLDGESTMILFNSINAVVTKSDLFKLEQKEMIASTNAKAKVEKEKEAKAKAMAASLERLRARALAAAQQSMIDKAASLDDDEEETPTTPSNPAIVAEPEAELEF